MLKANARAFGTSVVWMSMETLKRNGPLQMYHEGQEQ